MEEYPSRDKAVLFLESIDLDAAIEHKGRERILHHENGSEPWAVIHDPEGHNIVLIQKK